MNNTSKSDLKSEGGQDKIESDSETDGVQNKSIETVVLEDNSNNNMLLLTNDLVVSKLLFNGNLLLC